MKTANYKFHFEDRVTAFIDILGFSEFVKGIHANEEKSKLLYELLSVLNYKPQLKSDQCISNFEIAIDYYSDSISLSCPIQSSAENPVKANSTPLTLLFWHIAALQIRANRKGFLLRGAIAYGKMHVESNRSIGEPFIEAVRDEKNCAISPRIIFSKSFVDFIRPHEEEVQYEFEKKFCVGPNGPTNVFRKDNDGIYFFDYLRWYSTTHGSLKLRANVNETLNTIKEKILMKLQKFSKLPSLKIWQKYHWLASYFNDFIQEWNIQNPDHKIEAIIL